MQRLQRHYELVLEANRKFNLTSLTEPADAAVKLAADSLAVVAWARRAAVAAALRVLDVGTGAGFPAVPVAVCRPDWGVWAIDSTGKKARFVAQLAAELRLPNLLVEQVRARQWHGRVEAFDLVLVRALGPLEVCLRETARLVRPADGYLVCYQSQPAEAYAELPPPARRMADRYKLAVAQVWQYSLPSPDGDLVRSLLIFRRGVG